MRHGQSGFTLVYEYEGSNDTYHHILTSSTHHLTAPRSRLRWASASAIPMLIYVFRLPSSSLHSTPPRPCVVITPLRPIGRNMRANGLLLPHTPTLIKD